MNYCSWIITKCAETGWVPPAEGVTDEVAMKLYLKSTIPEKSYYKSLAGLAIRGYVNTARKLIEDKVNKNNIDLVIDEINDFVTP